MKRFCQFITILMLTTLPTLLTAQSVKLSPSDLLAASESHLLKLHQDTEHLLTKIKETDREKEPLKVNCLTEKLSALKGFNRIADQAYSSLKEAIARDNVQLVREQYKLLEKASQNAKKIMEESANCNLKKLYTTTRTTKITFEVDPKIAQEDPTEAQIDLDPLDNGSPSQ